MRLSSNEIGHNYAAAFIECLATPADVDRAGRDLDLFSDLLVELPALSRVLEHPGMPMPKRLSILDEALAKIDAHPVSKRLLHLVVEKGRVQNVRQIAANFAEMRAARLNLTSAEVVTAVPLDAAGRADWEHALVRLTGKKVSIDYQTDSSLIGGALTKVGSVIYDGSVRTQLEKIRGLLLKEQG
jgi:F-type H+-transporting ATPase subunit delta